ncbi:MAG: intradiol ring-cleavage dioxygenase [Candidatus Rokubacteria bacterium]|nr:intradiol ring-cleavage dioxygenase [Candidatus Rokubacteria bacterium]
MRDFPGHTVTDTLLRQLEHTPDKRLKQIMTSLVTHLHAFVREVGLTETEWFQGIKFLTETGQMCDDKRQEFILLSDTLGVSILVDAITHAVPSGATEPTLLGPFYLEGAPEFPTGANIAEKIRGETTFVSGRVTGLNGAPLAGALLDIWHAAPNGFYGGQASAPEFSLRGKFRTDGDGRYAFRTVKPASYPIPVDGPVGKMVVALGRQIYRPAHIHFIVSAKGYETLCTHIFVADDPYLEVDPVFAMKSSLVTEFVRHDAAEEARARGVAAPFYTMEYDFALTPAA